MRKIKKKIRDKEDKVDANKKTIKQQRQQTELNTNIEGKRKKNKISKPK